MLDSNRSGGCYYHNVTIITAVSYCSAYFRLYLTSLLICIVRPDEGSEGGRNVVHAFKINKYLALGATTTVCGHLSFLKYVYFFAQHLLTFLDVRASLFLHVIL